MYPNLSKILVESTIAYKEIAFSPAQELDKFHDFRLGLVAPRNVLKHRLVLGVLVNHGHLQAISVCVRSLAAILATQSAGDPGSNPDFCFVTLRLSFFGCQRSVFQLHEHCALCQNATIDFLVLALLC